MTIPVIVSTGSLFNYDLDTVMKLAREVGFDGIELMIDWRRETQHPAHLQAVVARYDLPILAVHSPFVRMDLGTWPADPIASIKQSVSLAETVGARVVVIHPPRRWVRLQGLLTTPNRTRKISVPLPLAGPGRLGHWLQHDLANFQATTEVKIALENMPCRRLGPLRLEPHHYTDPIILNRFPYLTLDTTHVGTRQIDLLHYFEQVEQRVIHIHLSNYNGAEHQLPTNGFLPLTPLLNRLLQEEFSGLVSLELNPTSLQSENETFVKQNLRESLAFCRHTLGVEVRSR
jgi:sugar phosphate isomerase/epimerase